MKKLQHGADEKGQAPLFADDRPDKADESNNNGALRLDKEPWKIMVVDDDDTVHQVTVMVLADYTFKDRPVEIIQGYSGGACRKLMKQHPDTAMLLLDVVMETDSAGLDTVKYIRDDLDNHTVQIIIRTGQPGQAPKKEVISHYEINGYAEKTDFTAQKLVSCITTSLCDFYNIKNPEAGDTA